MCVCVLARANLKHGNNKTIPLPRAPQMFTNLRMWEFEVYWKIKCSMQHFCVCWTDGKPGKKPKFKTISENPSEIPCYLMFSDFICVWMQVIVFFSSLDYSNTVTCVFVVKLENFDFDLMLLLLLPEPISLFLVSFPFFLRFSLSLPLSGCFFLSIFFVHYFCSIIHATLNCIEIFQTWFPFTIRWHCVLCIL